MHDLNDALDELRHVIPYAHSPSVRKLSKIATLLLAKNYILMQTNALNELRRVLVCLHSGNALPATLSASMSALLGANQQIGSHRSKHDSWSPGGATVAAATAAATATATAATANSNSNSNQLQQASPLAQQIKLTGSGALQQVNESQVGGGGGKRGSMIGGNQLAPQAANSAAGGPAAVDEQQTTSVQNRRRKYNMLINRILGDVAGQHLVNPLQFPPTAIIVAPPPQQQQQQQHPPSGIAVTGSNSHATNLRPIDFCTQGKRPVAMKSCSPSDCNTNKRRALGTCSSSMSSAQDKQQQHSNCKPAIRGGEGGGKVYGHRIENGSGGAGNNNSEGVGTRLMASIAEQQQADENSSESSRSGASGCSSLVSVGSPIYGSGQQQQQRLAEFCERPALCESASTIASYVEEEVEADEDEQQQQQQADEDLVSASKADNKDATRAAPNSYRCEQQQPTQRQAALTCSGPMMAASDELRAAGDSASEEVARYRCQRRRQQQQLNLSQNQRKTEVDDSLNEMKVNS